MNNENELIETSNQNLELKRSDLLTILCVLSFIGGGMGFLANILTYSYFGQLKEMFAGQDTVNFLGTEININMFLNVNPTLFLWQAVFSALSIIGAAIMWRLNKTGFHVYTIAQIILLMLPQIYISGLPFNWLELSLSLLFIYLYAKSLKIIEKK